MLAPNELAEPGTAVSPGDDCIAFLGSDVTLKARGQRCEIYYVNPIHIAEGVSHDGLRAMKSVDVKADVDAFRVKPAYKNPD